MSRCNNKLSVRRGYTIIEMVVVIGVLSLLLAGAFGLMVSMLRADAGQRIALFQQAELTRLADQFRRDAHRAAEVEIKFVDEGAAVETASEAATEELVFTLPGGHTITYRVGGGGVLVRLAQSADSQSGGRGTRERFTLPSELEACFALDDEARLVELVLTQVEGADATGSPTHPLVRPQRITAGYGWGSPLVDVLPADSAGGPTP